MRRVYRAVYLGIGLAGILEACGGGGTSPSQGAPGQDASDDVKASAGDDESSAPADAGFDATLDGGSEASTGISDAAADASLDAGAGFDASAGCTDGGMTTVSGTVYAPNGTLALYGVTVYVPSAPPTPMTHGVGATCEPCSLAPAGGVLSSTTTTTSGTFILPVPSGVSLPVVIEIGKWRKQLALPAATACIDTPLSAQDTTLPSHQTDVSGHAVSVEMPQIAVSTGNADALECLFRKLGVSDEEFTTLDATDAGPVTGRVHMFADTSSTGVGSSSFASGFAGGAGNFADSQTRLWASLSTLSPYDVVVLSCEGGQYPETKPQPALTALKQYADLGGHVLMSHWHNIWIEGPMAADAGQQSPVWTTLASWSNATATLADNTSDTIDVSTTEGAALADWMVATQGSMTKPYFPLADGTGKTTCSTVDDTRVSTVAILDGTHSSGVTGKQMFQFTTPVESAGSIRCGEVAFSDVHVSGDSTSVKGTKFPNGCAASGLTAQEKALAFMLFDITRCGD
jgi:hypothetical protein